MIFPYKSYSERVYIYVHTYAYVPRRFCRQIVFRIDRENDTGVVVAQYHAAYGTRARDEDAPTFHSRTENIDDDQRESNTGVFRNVSRTAETTYKIRETKTKLSSARVFRADFGEFSV